MLVIFKKSRLLFQGRTLFLTSPINRFHNLFETLQPSLYIFNDFTGKNVRVGEIVQVCQALVFEPEDIQIGFVPGDDFLVSEFPPSSFGVFFGLGSGPGAQRRDNAPQKLCACVPLCL